MIKIIFPILLTGLISVNIFAQTTAGDSTSTIKKNVYITDTTHECTVITSSRSVYEDVVIYGLSDSSVKVLKQDVSKELLIREIRTIKFHPRGFQKGALIGAGIGFAVGFIVGGQGLGFSKNFKFGEGVLVGMITALPICLIGGGIGALFAGSHLYDLGNMDLKSKREKVSYLIKEFSDR